MPDERGVPTLHDLIGQATGWAKNIEDAKTQKNQYHKLFQQSHIVDPKTGKSMAGVFNPATGEYQPSDYQLGYAPKIDPMTGLVLPNAVAEQTGLNVSGITPNIGPTNTPPSVPQSQPSPRPAPSPRTPPAVKTSPGTLNPVQRKGMADAVDSLEKDPIYSEAKNRVYKTDRLINTARMAQSDPIALGSLGTEMAKYAGEVGVLTENDVTRYIQDPSIAGRVRQSLYRLGQGTYSPDDAKNLVMLLESKLQDHQKEMGGIRQESQHRVQTLYGVPGGTASSVLAPPSTQNRLAPRTTPEANQMRQMQTTPNQGIVDKGRQWFQGLLTPNTSSAPVATPAQPMTDAKTQRYLELKQKHGR